MNALTGLDLAENVSPETKHSALPSDNLVDLTLLRTHSIEFLIRRPRPGEIAALCLNFLVPSAPPPSPTHSPRRSKTHPRLNLHPHSHFLPQRNNTLRILRCRFIMGLPCAALRHLYAAGGTLSRSRRRKGRCVDLETRTRVARKEI
jgi:hypothetical protein